MSEPTWPTHAAPRITEMTFADILTEGPRVFTGVEEIGDIWKHLTNNNIDPTFALAHFYVESHFGTAGWNVWAEPPLHSWGNTLYVNSLLKDREGVQPYPASNGYTYTSYPDWTTGSEDYCLQLNRYRDTAPVPRYGQTDLLYGATAKWIGKPLGSAAHLNYLDIILSRMDRHDARPDSEGDLAIFYDGVVYNTNLRYKVNEGERWYTKAGGKVSYPFAAGGKAIFLGRVQGTSWVAVKVQTSRFNTEEESQQVIGYMPNFDKARVSEA